MTSLDKIVQWFLQPVYSYGSNSITILSIGIALVVFIASLILLKISRTVLKHPKLSEHLSHKFLHLLDKVFNITIKTIAALTIAEKLLGQEIVSTMWSLFSVPIFELKGNKISLISIFAAILIFGIALWLSSVAEKMARKALKDTELDSGIRGSIERFVRYGVLTLGILITLDSLGVSLTSLAAVGAMLMVGVGFGLQNITQNFISGLIILLERPVKKGDLVQVGDSTGKILDIHARSTLVLTRDDIAIIVPNSQFISEQVVNESYTGQKVRVHIKVGVAYGTDAKLVKKLLIQIGLEHNKILKTPEPNVFFEDFGSSSLDFKLTVWIKDIWNKDQILSDLRFAIDEKFKEQSISIPFPQRDLHLVSNQTGITPPIQ